MTTAIVLAAGQDFAIRRTGLGTSPIENVAIEIPCNFNLDSVLTKDFTRELQAEKIPYLQSVYIDNSANANPLTLAIQGTAYSITVKAHTQGWYPLSPAQGPLNVTISSTQAAVVPVLTFTSFMVPYVNWATQ